jgi:CheY-like chemotaxis protein
VLILIVEDEPGIREALAECVATLGVEVATVSNGQEAIEQLRGGLRPDAILTDLALPFLDGHGLLAALRNEREFAAIPVVTMTGSTEKPRFPVAAHLEKPFDLDELGKALGRLLERTASA